MTADLLGRFHAALGEFGSAYANGPAERLHKATAAVEEVFTAALRAREQAVPVAWMRRVRDHRVAPWHFTGHKPDVREDHYEVVPLYATPPSDPGVPAEGVDAVDERQAFEEWVRERNRDWDLFMRPGNVYREEDEQAMWECWQARAALSAKESKP